MIQAADSAREESVARTVHGYERVISAMRSQLEQQQVNYMAQMEMLQREVMERIRHVDLERRTFQQKLEETTQAAVASMLESSRSEIRTLQRQLAAARETCLLWESKVSTALCTRNVRHVQTEVQTCRSETMHGAFLPVCKLMNTIPHHTMPVSLQFEGEVSSRCQEFETKLRGKMSIAIAEARRQQGGLLGTEATQSTTGSTGSEGPPSVMHDVTPRAIVQAAVANIDVATSALQTGATHAITPHTYTPVVPRPPQPLPPLNGTLLGATVSHTPPPTRRTETTATATSDPDRVAQTVQDLKDFMSTVLRKQDRNPPVSSLLSPVAPLASTGSGSTTNSATGSSFAQPGHVPKVGEVRPVAHTRDPMDDILALMTESERITWYSIKALPS